MNQNESICPPIENITICSTPPCQPTNRGLTAIHSYQTPDPSAPRTRGRATLLWGISGGTVLSVVGFVALCFFEKYNDGLNELNADLKHFNIACADLVKKDELRNLRTRMWGSLKELQTAAAAANVRDTRIAQLEQQLQTADADRKELTHELQRLRERLACVEGRQAATPIVVPGSQPIKSDRTPN